MSPETFLMSLWMLFRLSAEGLSSLTRNASERLSQNSAHSFLRKRKQPSMPLVSQGFDASTGPRNIS